MVYWLRLKEIRLYYEFISKCFGKSDLGKPDFELLKVKKI